MTLTSPTGYDLTEGEDQEIVGRFVRMHCITISGETLCCDNRQLIGTPLIVIARQSQKNRD